MVSKNELRIGVRFDVDNQQLEKSKRQITELTNSLQKIQTEYKSAKLLGDVDKDFEKAAQEAKKLEQILNESWNSKIGQLDLSKFNNSLKQSYGTVGGLREALKGAGADGTTAFNNIASSVLNSNKELKQTSTLLDKMALTMANTIRFGISSSIFNNMTSSISKAYNYAKDLDTSLNNIRIVSGQSAEQMERYAKYANQAAKDLGASTLDYTDASLIYYQQGLDPEEVIERTDITMKAANVLGTSAQEVSEYMTAIWNNFDDGSKSLEYYADVLTALGASTASSSEEIAEGLSKFAAVGDTVGLSYEYATSALATVVAETRQSADTVGTAFKTLFARIQDLELGQTLDDGTTLGKYSEALEKVGINIKDQNGQLKDMDVILNEMGSKWQTLNKDQQVALAQNVAGVRQYTQLVALMDNWDKFTANLNTANNATGALQKQQDIYMESTEAHLQKLSTEAERTYDILFDTDTVNSFADSLTNLLGLFNTLLTGLGGGTNALTFFGATFASVFNKQIGAALERQVENFEAFKSNLAGKQVKRDFIEEITNQYKQSGESDPSEARVTKEAEVAKKIAAIEKTLTPDRQKELNDLQKKMGYYAEQINYAEHYQDYLKKANVSSKLGTEAIKEQLEMKKQELEAQKEVVKYLELAGHQKVDKSSNERDLEKRLKEEFSNPDNILRGMSGNQGALLERIMQSGRLSGNDADNFLEEQNELIAEQESRVKNLEAAYAGKKALEDGSVEVYKKFNEEGDKEVDRETKLRMRQQNLSTAIQLMTTGVQIFTTINGLLETATDKSKPLADRIKTIAITAISAGPMILASIAKINAGLPALVVKLGLVKVAEDGVAVSAMEAWAAILGPLALIVAGIAAVVAIVQALDEAYNRDANAAKAAAKAADEVTKSTDQVKQSLNNLKTAFNAYDTAVTKLEACTKGTKEWQEALDGVNKAAVELLDKIPAGINGDAFDDLYEREQGTGRLVIKEDKLQKVITSLENAVEDSKMATARAEQISIVASNRSFITNLSRSINQKSESTEAEVREALSTLQAEFKTTNYSVQEFKQRLLDLGIDISQFSDGEIGKWRNELDRLSTSSENAAKKLELITQLNVDSKFGDQAPGINNIVAARTADESSKLLSDYVKRFQSDLGNTWAFGDSSNGFNKNSANNIYTEALNLLNSSGEYNLSASSKPANMNKDSNQIEISFFDNATKQDIKFSTLALSEIMASIKSGQLQQGWGEEVQTAFDNYRKNTNDETADALEKFFNTGDPGELTKKQTDLLKQNGGFDDEQLAQLMNLTTEQMYKIFGTSLEHLGINSGENPLSDIWLKADKSLVDYVSSESKTLRHALLFELSNIDLADEVTNNQKKMLAKIAEDAYNEGGKPFLDTVVGIFSKIDTKEIGNFAGALQNVKNWSSITAEELQTKLAESGVSINFTTDELNNLINSMEQMTYATKTLSDTFNSITQVTGVTDKLKQGDVVSAVDFNTLSAEMAKAGISIDKYFTKLRNGTYQLTESTEDFQDIINNFATNEITAVLEGVNKKYSTLKTLQDETSKDNFRFDDYTSAATKAAQASYEEFKKAFEQEAAEADKQLKEKWNKLAVYTTDRTKDISAKKEIPMQYGNIDLNNRAQLSVSENLPNASEWIDNIKEATGSVATVLGSWGEYGKNKIPIAFSPILQTGEGQGEILTSKTINDYIDQIVEKSDGTKEDIIRLDAEGIEIGGQKIKNIIADVGDTAEETSKKMHEVEEYKELLAKADSYYTKGISEEGYGTFEYNYPSEEEFMAQNDNVTKKLQTQFDILSALYGDQSQVREWMEAFNSKAGLTLEQQEEIGKAVESCREKYEKLKDTVTSLNAESYEASLQILKQYDNVRDLKEAYESKKGTPEAFNAGAYNEALLQLEDTHRREDFDDKEIERYADYLQDVAAGTEKWSEDLKDNADSAEDLSIQIQRMNKGVDDLADNWENWSDVLKKSTKGSEEYYQALTKTQEALSDLLDIEPNFFSDDFITSAENMALIEQAAKGDEAAIDSLRQNALQDIILHLELDDSAINNDELWARVQNIQAVLDSQPFKWGTEVDLTGLQVGEESMLDYLNNMILEAGMSADQVNAMLSGMGFTANFAAQPQTVMKHHEAQYDTIRTISDIQRLEDGTISGYRIHDEKVQTQDGWDEPIKIDAYSMQTSEPGTTVVPKINSLTKKAGGAANNHSSKNKGGGKPGKSSGGGGSKAKEPNKMDKLDDQADRYHKVNTQIAKVENSLKKLTSQEGKLVGAKLIANLNEQWAQLNTQVANYNEKLRIAQGEQAELRKELAGKGAQFNADGTISNYMEAFAARQNYVNSLIDKYNSMSAEEQEKHKETIEKAKEDFKKFQEDLDKYDKLISDEIPGLRQSIQDAVDQQIEINIKKFNMEVDITLNMAEAERDWNKWKAKVLDGVKETDILGNAQARLQDFSSYYNQQATASIQVQTRHLENTLSELKKMDAGLDNVYGDNRSQALEDLQTYYQQLMEDLEGVLDLQTEIHQAYLDIMDEAQEKFDEQLDTYEMIGDLLQNNMKIVQLVYGEDSYSQLSNYYQQEYDNNVNRLDFLRQQKQLWADQMKLFEEGSEEWKSAKEKWMEAAQELSSTLVDSLETAREGFENTIKEIFQDLNNLVTNDLGLDYVKEEWDLINKNADEYLDTINAVAGIRDLESKYIDAINDADSTKNQQRLNALMESELNTLRSMDKISQADLDRAELKYQIALAQLALEDAQQKKTQMRLRRDSQGNYSYQYTADEDAINKAKEELSNLYVDLYNFDKDQYKENLDTIYSVWEEYQQKMAEAALINDPEVRAQRELLIQQEYDELLNGLLEKNTAFRTYLQESSFMTLSQLYQTDLMNFTALTQGERDSLLNEVGGAFNTLLEVYGIDTEAFKNMTLEEQNAIITNLGSAFQTLTGFYNEDKKQFDKLETDNTAVLTEKMVPQWTSAIQAMADKISGKGGLQQTTEASMTKIKNATAQYDKQVETLAKTAGKTTTEIGKGLDKDITKTRQLVTDNTKLITSYNNELKAVKKVCDQIDTLIKKYQNAESAAKKATEAAYKYWLQEKQKQAAAAKKQTQTSSGSGNHSSSSSSGGGGSPAPASPQGNGHVDVGDRVTLNGKLAVSSYNSPTLTPISKYRGAQLYIQMISNGAKSPYHLGTSPSYSSSTAVGWVDRNQISGYDTGGYTGEWDNKDGRLAVLHEKELVLNAKDTENMLNTVAIMRNLATTLGGNVLAKLAGVAAGNGNGKVDTTDTIEQNVHIDATFPGVKDAKEIEDALNNLVNSATQRIFEKR